MTRRKRARSPRSAILLTVALCAPSTVLAQAPVVSDTIDERCIATALNRQLQADEDGTVIVNNIPIPFGGFRLRLVCEREDGTTFGESELLFGVPNEVLEVTEFVFTTEGALPVEIVLQLSTTILSPTQLTAQSTVIGTLSNGSTLDITASNTGTFYLSSNPEIVSVSSEGLLTAQSSGTVLVTAIHEGAIATALVDVAFSTDSDGDGIPDDFELARAVNPGGANAAAAPGVLVVASSASAPPENVIDGDLFTSWFTAVGDAANLGSNPFIEMTLPQDVNAAQIRILGNRAPLSGADFFAGVVQVFDGLGAELFNSGPLLLPAPNRDVTVPLDLAGVRRVRFTGLADEGSSPGLAEVQLLTAPGGAGLDPSDPNDAGQDFDGDGLTNLEEFSLGTSLFLADTDGDGLDDAEEAPLGVSPLIPDTDGDGLLDGAEPDPLVDTDNDGTVNILDVDSDNDGLPDGIEIVLELDPLRVDSDFDGTLDGGEDNDLDGLPNLEEITENTDPLDPDTDDDAVLDGDELILGCNPLVAERTSVSGRVMDELGAAIEGATVRIGGSPDTATSDAGGLFTNRKAPIAIVEFSDYQCPYCRRFVDQTFPQIKEKYIDTGKVRYVFRDLPLTQIHPEAIPAAVVANCSGQQGRYWEMHDLLFEHQRRLGEELYQELATELELDESAFGACRSEANERAEVDADSEYAASISARGTPHFFIGRVAGDRLVDAVRIGGAEPFSRFEAVLKQLVR